MMNPGKKDNVYVGKSNGQRQYKQKRYLLWPIRDLLNILNTPENNSYVNSYGEELPFSVLYRFLKEHKQYIFNKNVPHNAFLCEICENTVLLSKGSQALHQSRFQQIHTQLLSTTRVMVVLPNVCKVDVTNAKIMV